MSRYCMLFYGIQVLHPLQLQEESWKQLATVSATDGVDLHHEAVMHYHMSTYSLLPNPS